MRIELIESHVTELSRVLGGIKPLVPAADLQRFYQAKEYTNMVGFIRNSMGLYLNVRVGYVNSGGPENAPAWVDLPETFPIIGSKAFKSTSITLYIRKSFIEAAPFASVVSMMAHEMAHVLLGALRASLADDEEATDLTAMILGYSQYFVDGCLYIKRWMPSTSSLLSGDWSDLFSDPSLHQLGYLSPEEVLLAAEVIKRSWIFQTMRI